MTVTSAATKLLEWLNREDANDPYASELVYEKGKWMAGTKRVRTNTANELLWFCLISQDSYESGMERWRINGTGKEMLADSVGTEKKVYELLHPARRVKEDDGE